MKRILAMFIAVIMVFAICALTGCGDKGKTDPTTINSSSDNTKESGENAALQAAYEDLFNNPTTMELNAKNVTASMTSGGVKVMEVSAKESGDYKMTMYLSESLGYTTYVVGEDSYVEMHIPEYTDSNGKTVKAEDVYYKTKKADSSVENSVSIENLVDSLQLSKENIKSVKYIETKEVEGVNCDVVEVVHTITTNASTDTDSEEVDTNVNAAIDNENKSDDSDKTSEDSGVAEAVGSVADSITDSIDNTAEAIEDETTATETTATEKTEVTTTFYFTADGRKLFGFSSGISGMQTQCYCPSELTVELPKDVKFVDADDEKISEKMMSLYTAIFAQKEDVVENETSDSSSN